MTSRRFATASSRSQTSAAPSRSQVKPPARSPAACPEQPRPVPGTSRPDCAAVSARTPGPERLESLRNCLESGASGHVPCLAPDVAVRADAAPRSTAAHTRRSSASSSPEDATQPPRRSRAPAPASSPPRSPTGSRAARGGPRSRARAAYGHAPARTARVPRRVVLLVLDRLTVQPVPAGAPVLAGQESAREREVRHVRDAELDAEPDHLGLVAALEQRVVTKVSVPGQTPLGDSSRVVGTSRDDAVLREATQRVVRAARPAGALGRSIAACA